MKNISDKKFLWNMLGSLANAFSSMILLIIVNRVTNAYNGGLFSLGFSTAQMMTTVGTLEVRNYQATDIKETFKFNDYYSFRICTCLLMMICSIGYVFANGYTLDKLLVTLLLCLYKMIEAYSDVFEGLFQQKDRIDLSGKTMCYRVCLSTVIFILSIVITKSLLSSITLMFLSSLVFAILYNRKLTTENWFSYNLTFNFKIWKEILIQCLPLAIGAFIILYMGNAPKYAVDSLLGEEIQNIFSILFMPAFIINLFSLFAFRPMLTSLAIAWDRDDNSRFFKIILGAFAWLLIISCVCLLGAYLLGIPILTRLYGLDLSNYKTELMLIMLGGCVNAFSTILRFTLTVIRKQMISILGYIIAFVFTIILCPVFVTNLSILGACISYIFSMLILSIVFILILLVSVKWKK